MTDNFKTVEDAKKLKKEEIAERNKEILDMVKNNLEGGDGGYVFAGLLTKDEKGFEGVGHTGFVGKIPALISVFYSLDLTQDEKYEFINYITSQKL